MGKLIVSFKFNRSALMEKALDSARSVKAYMDLVQGSAETVKKDTNRISPLRTLLGVFDDNNNVTAVGQTFLRLYARNSEDAWRWLITRSLWLYTVPNGTTAEVNAEALKQGVSFSFFHTMLGLLMHLSAHAGKERFLYYKEMCILLNDDANWPLDASGLYGKLQTMRAAPAYTLPQNDKLIDDLEPAYGVAKDNLNTIFNKAFMQTGLFDYYKVGARLTGVALSATLDPVLQRRVRIILDTSLSYTGNSPSDWAKFLQNPPDELPEEVSFAPSEPQLEEPPDEDIRSLSESAARTFNDVGLQIEESLIRRFAASLLAKRFVILTGLSGSGKTKLAQAFARWITPSRAQRVDIFTPGSKIKAQTIEYEVILSDDVAIELVNPEGTRSVLPRRLIKEWAECIRQNDFAKDTPAKTIREEVAKTTKYSGQINSFDSILKAAAFGLIEAEQDTVSNSYYEVIPVGAEWTSKENIFGYADAISDDKYVRTTPAVDLILRAYVDSSRPYFLILDEMNLSHVERYFADFLSVIESEEELQFHRAGKGESRALNGVPETIKLPDNLFVIGTVNIDETTYMFSPKVLDRANSIEFRVKDEQLVGYLSNSSNANLRDLDGDGRGFARAFITTAQREDVTPSDATRFRAEMILLFRVLAKHGAEFGFRTVKEMGRFIRFHELLSTGNWSFEDALDAQICQKVLPKLHGSQRNLEPILCALAVLCWYPHEWNDADAKAQSDDPLAGLTNSITLLKTAMEAASLNNDNLHPLSPSYPDSLGAKGGAARYPISFDKIKRMLTRLTADGFASFAEA